MHSNRFMPLYLTVGAVITLTALGQRVVADALLRLNPAQAGDFHQAVTALAEQGHVSLVAEGVPLHSHLLPEDAAKLTAPATLDDEVKAVADAYDYSVQRTGNVFVLKKRYSHPDDLPALTQAECEHTLVLLPRLADSFNPHALSHQIQFLAPQGPQLRPDQVRVLTPLVDSFVASLTQDQLALMHQKNSPVSSLSQKLTPDQVAAMLKRNYLLVSSLSQNQKTMARQLRLSLYIQKPMDKMALLPPILKQVEQSAVFCWQDYNQFKHVFGYTIPEPEGDKTTLRFHPLSHSTGGEEVGIYNFTGPVPKPTDPDPTDPSPAFVQDNTPAAQTLADAVAFVNAHANNTIQADVDPAVAAKLVTLAGIDNASAGQALRALADVYGLRLSDPPSNSLGKFLLTLPDVAPPSELVALPSSLRQALPEPFARATHLDRVVAEEQKFYDFWQLPRDPKHPTPAARPLGIEETPAELEQAKRERERAISDNVNFQSGLDQIKQAEAAMPLLRIAAIRRLRALLEPKLQAKPDGIAISDLSEPEREAVATIFLVEAVQILGKLITEKVPDTALHFDQAALEGGIRENTQPPSFFIEFHMLNSPSGLEINGGGISVPYYKDIGKDGVK